MGEYAEMMLDGTCCEGCGDFLGDGEGFPRYCSPECAHGRGQTFRAPSKSRVSCPQCGKRTKEAGLWQHMRDKHGSGYGRVAE